MFQLSYFLEMSTNDLTSGLLQVLLKCIAPVSKKRFKALVNKLMQFLENENGSYENGSFVRYLYIYLKTLNSIVLGT